MDRRTFLRRSTVVGVAGLAGCTGGPTGGSTGTETESETPAGTGTATPTASDGGDGSGTGTAESTTAASGPAANVGMVYATGGLGDGSFNDQAQQGAKRAREELGIEFSESQPEETSQFKTFQQQYAQSTSPDYDLICCIGFLQTNALKETAPDYPDQHFMLVDSVVEADNVANYVFAEEEGSYLVGQLAGLLTTREFAAGAGETTADSTSVGFVGGVESPLIKKFEAGYVAGVTAANGDVDVQSTYVGDFNDPTGGKEAALAMYSSGADIVYHASGNTGTGVFQAAQEEGRFAIGVDRDQSVTKESFADVILASMVKRVDTAVFNAIEAEVEGNFEAGTTALGLANEGVAITYGQSLGSEIPEEVRSPIADSRQAIVDGDIDVPTDPSNV
jgi:basic membrane protein A